MSAFVLAALLTTAARAAASATVEAQSGDASITHDLTAHTWSVAAGGATLKVAIEPSRDYQLLTLISPSGQNWLPHPTAGATITIGGMPLTFGSRDAGFEYNSTTVASGQGRLQLDTSYLLRSANLRVMRHLAVTSGSPTFEMWTSFAAINGDAARVSTINAVQFAVPAGTVRWLNGLQGDSADVVVTSEFTLRQQIVPAGGQMSLGSDSRSSAQTVPWFAVDGSKDEFYSALMWSGAWSLSLARVGETLQGSFGLPPMDTTVDGQGTDGPHVLIGVATGGLGQAAAGLRTYLLNGIRGGRALTPLVTYNTWFAYGTDIDEASMRAEMKSAADLGTELFVIDAGWYTGAGVNGPFDFDSGLGTWEADPVRFPNGLRPLRDYAHSLGMQFGVWVEPERVNLSTVDAGGPDESWLATNKGDYGSDHAAQICLASAAARDWLLAQLATFIDTVQPDYLKWDNNFWVNCDRDGHGHGATDGNFRHVSGLYDVLGTLRQWYPDLLIENVSGGGNRLDYGMLRYTDVAWMDDRTAPSVHVRHNLEGLSAAFPPAALLSFVTDYGDEPLHDAPDLPLYVRSRMAGALGLCFRAASVGEKGLAELSRQITIYKDMRGTLGVAAAGLLTAQAAQIDSPPWDVLQAATPGAAAVLVYAYQLDPTTEQITVKPTGLDPASTYAVRSIDTGTLGEATGADLMANGIDVQSAATAAHILVLQEQQ